MIDIQSTTKLGVFAAPRSLESTLRDSGAQIIKIGRKWLYFSLPPNYDISVIKGATWPFEAIWN